MMRFYPAATQSHLQQGIALLEILISVLVLGIGLLGIAALQSSSVRYSQSAQERTTALIMASSLTEIIRSNADTARSGAYAGDCGSELLADWALQLQAATGHHPHQKTTCGHVVRR